MSNAFAFPSMEMKMPKACFRATFNLDLNSASLFCCGSCLSLLLFHSHGLLHLEHRMFGAQAAFGKPGTAARERF